MKNLENDVANEGAVVEKEVVDGEGSADDLPFPFSPWPSLSGSHSALRFRITPRTGGWSSGTSGLNALLLREALQIALRHLFDVHLDLGAIHHHEALVLRRAHRTPTNNILEAFLLREYRIMSDSQP